MSSETFVKILRKMLFDEKTFRDPVLGDLNFSLLECNIIDTEIFQRLRRIKQLGTVHLVFPGAEHSRFQHSLGTYHMAKILLENIEKNSSNKYPFGDNEIENLFFKVVVRLGALLHDLYELPLSHTLEKEGNIFEKQWKNDELNKKIFGEDSELYGAISRDFENQHEYYGLGENLTGIKNIESMSKIFASTILVYVYKILTETNDSVDKISKNLFPKIEIINKVFNLKYINPCGFIIRDTICADLLDYLARDFYFCGIEKKYDKRFLAYATFIEIDNSIVFAYSLLDKRGNIKHSVLSSLFDVLELRYSLAEIVHIHRVKNSFSVMIIEAFNFYYQSLDKESKYKVIFKLMKLGDDELLNMIRENNSVSKYIIDYYYKHDNYKELVLWDNWDNVSNNLSNEGYDLLRDPEERLKIEKLLIMAINRSLPEDKHLQIGDILIYVMIDPKNLWKDLETFVIYSKEKEKYKTSPLNKLAAENVLSYRSPTMRVVAKRVEIQSDLLMEKYKNLWRISMFISPKIVNDNFYKEQSLIAADLIDKVYQILGEKITPSAPKKPLNFPSEITDILNIAKEESRSYKKIDDILKLFE